VCLIEAGLAAAFGAGIRPEDRRASTVIDLGSATTTVAVVAGGKIVAARAERIGSWDINAAIINHVRRHRGLLIGEQTGERLKRELASAVVPSDLAQATTIRGLDVLTRTPASIEITAGEIYPVAQEVVRKIVDHTITPSLTELPPEVAADIQERAIILTGGGAQFAGFDEYLRAQTKLPIQIADEPGYAIVRGLERMFEEPLWLRRVIRESPMGVDLASDSL